MANATTGRCIQVRTTKAIPKAIAHVRSVKKGEMVRLLSRRIYWSAYHGDHVVDAVIDFKIKTLPASFFLNSKLQLNSL